MGTGNVAGVSTLGVRFCYAPETTAGQKPTTGWKELSRINDIAGISDEPQAIDASALSDRKTRNIPGRDTVSETMAVTVNKTDDTVAEWKECIQTYQALTGGKRMWFQEITPGLTNAEFYVAAPPSGLPKTAKEQNGLLTMEIPLVVDEMMDDAAVIEPAGE